ALAVRGGGEPRKRGTLIKPRRRAGAPQESGGRYPGRRGGGRRGEFGKKGGGGGGGGGGRGGEGEPSSSPRSWPGPRPVQRKRAAGRRPGANGPNVRSRHGPVTRRCRGARRAVPGSSRGRVPADRRRRPCA